MWSTSGDGTFDDATQVNASYTPGTEDIDTELVTLTLTGESDMCGSVLDDMELSINTLGIGKQRGNMDVSIYPNPTQGTFKVELSGKYDKEVSLRVYNSLSGIVYNQENILTQGNYTETITLDVEPGVYYLRIEGEDVLVVEKVVVKK